MIRLLKGNAKSLPSKKPEKGLCNSCLSVWGTLPSSALVLGLSSNFVGSESSHKQSVKVFLYGLQLNPTPRPRPPAPATSCLHLLRVKLKTMPLNISWSKFQDSERNGLFLHLWDTVLSCRRVKAYLGKWFRVSSPPSLGEGVWPGATAVGAETAPACGPAVASMSA
jgi:hypothetical protein